MYGGKSPVRSDGQCRRSIDRESTRYMRIYCMISFQGLQDLHSACIDYSERSSAWADRERWLIQIPKRGRGCHTSVCGQRCVSRKSDYVRVRPVILTINRNDKKEKY